MELNARIPVTLNGKPCELAFDMAAIVTLAETYDISLHDLPKLRSEEDAKKRLPLLMKLLFAMTRSMDQPPSQKDIQRVTFREVMLLLPAINQAINVALGSLGESAAAETVRPAASASASNGVAPLPKRSTASKSPRRSSGD